MRGLAGRIADSWARMSSTLSLSGLGIATERRVAIHTPRILGGQARRGVITSSEVLAKASTPRLASVHAGFV